MFNLNSDNFEMIRKNAYVEFGAEKRRANLVDLEKSCKVIFSITKISLDTAEEESYKCLGNQPALELSLGHRNSYASLKVNVYRSLERARK